MRKLMLLFGLVFMIGLISASNFTMTTNWGSATGSSLAEMQGVHVYVNQTWDLNNVTKDSVSPDTNAYLVWTNGTLIENTTYSAQVATFGSATKGLSGGDYFILSDAAGASRSQVRNNSAIFPYNTTDGGADYTGFNLVTGVHYGTANNTGVGFIFDAIGYGLPTVALTPTLSLNAPLNNSNVTNSVVLTITSNSSSASHDLQNLTLYLDGSLNETITFGASIKNNISTFTKSVSIGNVHNWTAFVCDNSVNCSLFAGNQSFLVQKIYEESQDFNTQGLEGSSQTFKLNISLSSGYSITAMNLTYNNTNYSATFAAFNSTLYQGSATITLPTITSQENKTFNWTVLLDDTSLLYSNSSNQTITNLGLDNCAVNNITILNFTMANEDSQSILNGASDGTSMKIDVILYTDAAKTTIANSFSSFYNQTNPATVCLTSELNSTMFYMDAQVEYGATNYQTEFYNIQSYSLNASANPLQNTTLYDLLTANAQEFKITYKDASFLPVSNALIQIQRKYVDEGIFKTVEIPKTDANGETVGNLVVNNVIYTFTVVKNGELLATFQNVQAVCQNPAITECTINLNNFASTSSLSNYETDKDIIYSISYDRANRTIFTDFSIPSGVPSNITLSVTMEDALRTAVCSSSVITSAGGLSCAVANNFGNGTVLVELYKDGVNVAKRSVDLQRTSSDIYGGILVMLGLFVVLTLIGAGVSDNPMFTIFFLLIGIIILYGMNLVNGTIGIGSTALFVIVAIIIIAVKGANRT